VLRKIKKMKSTSMGSEGVKTKHKAIMFPHLDKKCGILLKN